MSPVRVWYLSNDNRRLPRAHPSLKAPWRSVSVQQLLWASADPRHFRAAKSIMHAQFSLLIKHLHYIYIQNVGRGKVLESWSGFERQNIPFGWNRETWLATDDSLLEKWRNTCVCTRNTHVNCLNLCLDCFHMKIKWEIFLCGLKSVFVERIICT